MFADTYLHKNKFFPQIKELPDPRLGICVVIPCFREPDILKTLQSLSQCQMPVCHVEVIILINHSEIAPYETKLENQNTLFALEEWIGRNQFLKLAFYAVGPVDLKKKWAGAGLARKYGMDEALSRFNSVNNPDGIIVSLDADTLVEENYLTEIEAYFKTNPASAGATIRFKHQTEGLEDKHLTGIILYERYMDYYKKALQFTGYPYPMFTLGSAFAVRADAYVKRGGMNRRKAGEDFYFLQNLVQVGKVEEINSTCVFPSARLSNRVPFGTGPVLRRWMDGEEDLTITYNFSAFTDLKVFFDITDKIYQITQVEYEALLADLPDPLSAFLREDDFLPDVQNLSKNCATVNTFRQRFFHLFNAFKIFKFLNFTHEEFYQKQNLSTQIDRLMNPK